MDPGHAVETLTRVYDSLYAMPELSEEQLRVKRMFDNQIIDEETHNDMMQDYTKASRINILNNPYEDSPYHARVSMVSLVYKYLKQCRSSKPKVLNIGSGPQFLEWMLFDSANRNLGRHDDMDHFNRSIFYTLDRANIPLENLVTSKADFQMRNIHHINADALALPFGERSLDIVVANFSVDFIPGRIEIFRLIRDILEEDGLFVANFHHPRLEDDGAGRSHICTEDNDYRSHTPMYRDEQYIVTDLHSAGFKNVAVREVNNFERTGIGASEPDEVWWEIIAYKSPGLEA